jgi:hypothetical protein
MMSRWGKIRRKYRKLNMDDAGAAMVTMIVVVLFITILATTLLYISGMNFQIKQTNYRNQKSFYAGETSLEQIKAQLMVDVSEASAAAYSDTMSRYVALGSGDVRQWEYNQKFVEELLDIWDTHTGGNWKPWLEGYLTADAKLELPGRDANGDGVYSTAEMVEDHSSSGYVLIKGLKLTYTNSEGYTSIITTDFYVEAPALNWGVDSSEMTAPSDPVAAKEQELVEVADYVQYVNWEKQ